MSYTICKKCERFFKQNGNEYCEKCHRDMNNIKSSIRGFLEKNPNASVMEISMQLNIPMRDINTFINSGNVAISNDEDKWESPRESELRENSVSSRKYARKTYGRTYMGRNRRDSD